jgi:NADH-quinone oxidoreductase subunit M
MADLPLLSLLFAPLPLAAVLIWLAPSERWARHVALIAALAQLAISAGVLAAFDPAQAGFQLIDTRPWIASLNVNFALGVDGISVLFLPATTLLFVGVILASWTSVHHLPRLYYTLLLLLASATLGVFCALDAMLFFLFWEFTLVPLYFLVNFWGSGANRRYAATKYTLVMLAGGVPLLFGFVVLAYAGAGPGGLVFDLPALLAADLPKATQYAVFLLLLVGFGVKVPLFPLHTWLPVVALEGPAATSALLTGLKLGAYGLIRFAVPLAPQAAQELHWLLAGLGVLAIVYGAVAALAQTNLRRMLAYSSLAHVGLVVLGIASFDLAGLQGAVLQLLNFVFAAGGLFLLVAALQQRIGSTDVLHLGGAAARLPWLATFFLVFGLAGLGLPGTSGFPAELLLLVSALKAHTGAGLAALTGGVLGAAYFLGLYRRAFLGPITAAAVMQAEDLRPREFLFALVLALVILVVGLHPAPVLDLIRPAGEAWVARLR